MHRRDLLGLRCSCTVGHLLLPPACESLQSPAPHGTMWVCCVCVSVKCTAKLHSSPENRSTLISSCRAVGLDTVHTVCIAGLPVCSVNAARMQFDSKAMGGWCGCQVLHKAAGLTCMKALVYALLDPSGRYMGKTTTHSSPVCLTMIGCAGLL